MTEDKRENKTPSTGLLTDSKNESYDLTEWYKRSDQLLDILDILKEQNSILLKIETHLALITEEDLTNSGG